MEKERGSNVDVGAQTSTKNIRMSAAKVRRVAEQIQGCSYEEALVSPEFMPYKACSIISQLILSAAANATSNLGFQKKNMFISEVQVNNSTYLKRFRPRAQGRGFPIRKPTCRITIKSKSRSIRERT
uniref:Large ribosomal subunit protein uL22c n=1 Tax=Azolla nilotica TaxID=336974 RepID=A0A291R6Z2_9MONI|nr:ribosomal protein L22 [Azolla nilotica]